MDDNDFDFALRLGDLDALARLYDDPEVVRSLLPAVPTMRSASRRRCPSRPALGHGPRRLAKRSRESGFEVGLRLRDKPRTAPKPHLKHRR